MLRPRWIEPCSPSIRSADGLRVRDREPRLDLAEEGLPTHDLPLRGRDGGEDRVDDRLDGYVVGDGLEPEPDAVPEHVVAQRPDVVGRHERTLFAAARARIAACCRRDRARGLAPRLMYPARSGSMSSSARRVAWLIDTAYRCTSSSMYTRAVSSTRKPTSSSDDHRLDGGRRAVAEHAVVDPAAAPRPPRRPTGSRSPP